MKAETYGDGRTAPKFGQQKLNVRRTGTPMWKTCVVDAPGSLDLCFITKSTPAAVVNHFNACGVPGISGPVTRSGALGPITSIYCKDPDGNLIEVASYLTGE